ncbi:MAG: N-acetylmuramoyl-L-alanine amidase [Chloroflexota bacterium]|nr:N-acetylmuramoyl-L-alanine amidase [Chloroflexota bacterium]
MASTGILRRALLLLMAAALLPFASAGPVLAVAAPLVQGVRVTDSPFSPDGDGIRDRVLIDVTLSRAATVSVSVIDFKDKVVRSMRARSHDAGTFAWRWNGRDDGRRLAPDGAYRFRLDLQAADGLTETAMVVIAKAPVAPYPVNPSAVTVVLNAGHGGSDPGAVYSGVRESDMTLDIALRLEQMLEASGVTVVMLRDTDVVVNAAGADLNGDGAINQSDELMARNDAANLARGDLYVTLMNNAYGCHCVRGTETWTHDQRSWSPEALVLASAIQRAHLRRLRPFRDAGWYPIDRGVRFHDFAVVRPYGKKMRRPALMPSVMTESLFMDHANELRILKRPKVRGELAVAYFEGITEWLNGRRFGLRYEVLEAASGEAPSSGPAAYRMRLMNSGNRPSSGWQLRASVVPAVPLYDGSDEVGAVLGTVPIPDGLAPGAAASVLLDGLTLPAEAGDWLVKFDVILPNGGTLGQHGVVGPQVPIRTIGSDPSPDPTPDPNAADPSSGPAAALARPSPLDPWMRPAPGWGDAAWRGILAGVVRWNDHDPEHHHGHHHGDQ